MNLALTDLNQSNRIRNALNNLRNHIMPLLPPLRTFHQMHAHNWFPLYPTHTPHNIIRNLQQPPNPAYIKILNQGTTLELRGDQSPSATLTPHPLLALPDIAITCKLNLQTRGVDYKEIYQPFALFQLATPFDANPHLHFAPMDILSWNTRGARSTNFRRALRDMKNRYNPDIVILTETHLSGDRVATIITLGFKRYIKVDAMGFLGGIWVLWNPLSLLVEPIASVFHEVYFKVQVNYSPFLLTTLYASLEFSIRKTIWNKLSYLFDFITSPWIIIGDFNDISSPNEKLGGNSPSRTKMKA